MHHLQILLLHYLNKIAHPLIIFFELLPIMSDLVVIDEKVEFMVERFNVRGLVIKLSVLGLNL